LLIADWIRERSPVTVAAFMNAALYHPEFGYYARAAQRSGRAGDFFTSVDVGPLFGELLARQVAEMHGLLESCPAADPSNTARPAPPALDFVEVGAGNGRLSADVLHALRRDSPGVYHHLNAHLVEASAAARLSHRETLGESAARLTSSSATLPEAFEGILVANELLDALPVHQVVMREDGLHEVYVEFSRGDLRLREGPLSTPRIVEYLSAVGVKLEPGWKAEIGLAAADWVRDAATRLRRGFMILIDYGHDAAELYSVTHSSGTLTSFARHHAAGPESTATPWLQRPGQQDLTAHVDFTTVRHAAEAEGCAALGFLDQMYFLLALVSDRLETLDVKQRLALKTLVMPGGLGSTMKVLVLGKNVGAPRLAGLSSRVRVT
jgi:SAM-dependent MidA family methyltransferase